MPWCHVLLSMPVTGLTVFLFLPVPVAAPIYLVISAGSLFVYSKILQAMHRPVATGREGMIGREALVTSANGHAGVVRWRGELWKACSAGVLHSGDHVRIAGFRGLQLMVSGNPARGTDLSKVEDPATSRERKRYDRIAPFYDWMEGMMERLAFRKLRARLWAQVTGEKLLEVGVGTGKNIPYYPPGVEVAGIDLSPRMLERARMRAVAAHRKVDLREMDAQALGFPDASFDAVVGTFVFCSVPDPVAGLRELARVTKPGGRIFLLEHMRPRGRFLGRVFDVLNPLTVRAFGVNINRRTLENITKAGLRIREQERFGRSGIVAMVVAEP
jgi:phosphatidylethanolamine/phosphatidyl-N-methylethanolamine N-methyltransferase